jgi:hypothetical protein
MAIMLPPLIRHPPAPRNTLDAKHLHSQVHRILDEGLVRDPAPLLQVSAADVLQQSLSHVFVINRPKDTARLSAFARQAAKVHISFNVSAAVDKDTLDVDALLRSGTITKQLRDTVEANQNDRKKKMSALAIAAGLSHALLWRSSTVRTLCCGERTFYSCTAIIPIQRRAAVSPSQQLRARVRLRTVETAERGRRRPFPTITITDTPATSFVHWVTCSTHTRDTRAVVQKAKRKKKKSLGIRLTRTLTLARTYRIFGGESEKPRRSSHTVRVLFSPCSVGAAPAAMRSYAHVCGSIIVRRVVGEGK